MPNIVYTVAERVEMVRQHEQGLSYDRIRDHFAATYPDRPIPSKSTVRKIVKKFCETGNLDPSLIKVSYPSKQLTEETKLNICLTVEEGLKKPLSKIAQELHISKASVHKVIRSHKHKHKPYKLKNRQKISPTTADPPDVDPLCGTENNLMSDLSPLHYSLWSYLRNRLNSEGRIEDLNTLWDRVTEVLGELDVQIIAKINRVLDTTLPQVKEEVMEINFDGNSRESS